MLFNSYAFICAFLPAVLLGYHLTSKFGPAAAAAWLVLSSLAFYAYWNVAFVPMLMLSIMFNFLLGRFLLSIGDKPDGDEDGPSLRADIALAFGIICDLIPLLYFKYLTAIEGFFCNLVGIPGDDQSIILPLGISFYTFTQIGYLVDCRQGQAKDLDLIRYALFVSFFPHLAAGPLLHVREIAPQLLDRKVYALRADNLLFGALYFVIGLSKKVILADPLAREVALGFAHPTAFGTLSTWGYVLAYSMELYFDFSGYSDMAIGLAAMFGIKFPLNFNSPYKSRCIIDFWQRWHMTLTRYLTLLLYNPISLLVARRRQKRGLAPFRRGVVDMPAFLECVAWPTLVTMALAGIWHGAGLQFLVFGLCHAFYLTINQAWRAYGPRPREAAPVGVKAAIVGSQVLVTYLAVLVGQVFFRADSTGDALTTLGGMLGFNGWATPDDAGLPLPYIDLAERFFIVWALPNSQTIMQWLSSHAAKASSLRLNYATSLAAGLLLGCDMLMLPGSAVFLYFQF
jgi:alginate O-acetyltransferase complex protein AlgI